MKRGSAIEEMNEPSVTVYRQKIQGEKTERQYDHIDQDNTQLPHLRQARASGRLTLFFHVKSPQVSHRRGENGAAKVKLPAPAYRSNRVLCSTYTDRNGCTDDRPLSYPKSRHLTNCLAHPEYFQWLGAVPRKLSVLGG